MASAPPMSITSVLDRLETMTAAVTERRQVIQDLRIESLQIHSTRSVLWASPPPEDHPLRQVATLQSRINLASTEVEEIYAHGLGMGVYLHWVDRSRRVTPLKRRVRR